MHLHSCKMSALPMLSHAKSYDCIMHATIKVVKIKAEELNQKAARSQERKFKVIDLVSK